MSDKNLNKNTAYYQFREGQQYLLDSIPDKEEKEQAILKQLKKNMAKNKGNYFSLDDLMSIPMVKKLFKAIIISGDRNIGKTTALRRYCEKVNDDNKSWIWLRNKVVEVERVMPREKKDWFGRKGWTYKSDGSVFSSEKAKRDNDTNEILGYYKAVNNIENEKSIEYRDVNTIIYDEFNASKGVKDKFTKLTAFITTVERHKSDFNVILTGNYVNQADEILQVLGISSEKKSKFPLLVFNWVVGALLWFIPKNFYQKNAVKKTIGYRWSFGDYKTYTAQYGATYTNKYEFNIKDIESCLNLKLIFRIIVDSELYCCYSFDKDRQAIIVASDKMNHDEDVNLYSFDEESKLIRKNCVVMNDAMMNWLKDLWEQEKLWCDSIHDAEIMIQALSRVKEIEKPKYVNYV